MALTEHRWLTSTAWGAATSKWKDLEVAILGGGVSGLAAAFTLKKRGIKSTVYEARSRLGGRIHTIPNFNHEGMVAELGGEVLNTGDVSVLALAKELGLEIFDVSPKGMTEDVYYFGGQIRTNKDVRQALPILLKFINEDRKSFMPGGGIVVPTYRAPLGAQKWDQMNLRAYLDRLQQKGVEPWLISLLEAAYRGEYGLECSEQSALNLLVLLGADSGNFEIFGASDEAKRIRGGNTALIQALQEAINGATVVEPEHILRAIWDRETHFELSFDTKAGKNITTKARRLICTLPFSCLRKVEGNFTANFTPAKKTAIAELGYGSAAKLLLGFHRKFWGTTCSADIFTDLPSRRYWDCTNAQKGQSVIVNNFLSGREGRDFQKKYVDRAVRDLEQILPGAAPAFAGTHETHLWSHDPFSLGAYTCALPGQYTKFFGAIGEPELKGRILFAGEHCSLDWQGFIEGAVATGIAAAEQI